MPSASNGRAGVLRHSGRDAILVALAGGYGALLIVAPSALLIAVGFWWIANTVAHNFIHLPFFRQRAANALFSAYLSLLLGLPQTLWRDRHLAHHAERPWRLRASTRLTIESVLVAALWIAIAAQGPRLVFLVWLPGWLGGLSLCWLQGYYEHVRGTVSHYGPLYNLAFFNDGYHVEHHARPGLHWSQLPRLAGSPEYTGERSRWPAAFRWLEQINLEGLERLVLRSPILQKFVVRAHRRAFARLLRSVARPRRVTIVGGGLFPRTAIVLHDLLPDVDVTIVDRSSRNLESARAFLNGAARIVQSEYTPELCAGADLVIVPLAFIGDRDAFYRRPPAPVVAVHDWLWHPRGETTVVSVLLLKRLNLVRQ